MSYREGMEREGTGVFVLVAGALDPRSVAVLLRVLLSPTDLLFADLAVSSSSHLLAEDLPRGLGGITLLG